jgi:hypothetical protein
MTTIQQDKDGNWLIVDGSTLVATLDNRDAALRLQNLYDFVVEYRSTLRSFEESRRHLLRLREQWDALDLGTTSAQVDYDAFVFTKSDFVNALSFQDQVNGLYSAGVRTVVHKVTQ